jgi:predicted metal-dependent enzyme (double-stranded beta helix superfamily)
MLQVKELLPTKSAEPRLPFGGRAGDTGALAALVRGVEAACDAPAAMRDRLLAALQAAVSEPSLLPAEHRQGKADCYARHVLHSDPAGRFTVLALVWGPGQFSPPHAHHTWCSYAVLDGTLTETVYSYDEATAKASPLRVAERQPGYHCFSRAGLDQIHRLGNAGAGPAISIHVYGVDRERITTHVNRLVDVAQS